MLNGDGIRVVLWVAVCSHQCPNCQNPITWNLQGGLPFTQETRDEFFQKINHDYISGVTFSGGDPLHPYNRNTITELAQQIKVSFPDKSIWMYTGFLWEEVKSLPVMTYVDVLVDGEFIEELKDNKLHWKGSSNQRVIDVQKSLNGEVVLYNT